MEGGASQALAIAVDPGDAFRVRGDSRAGDWREPAEGCGLW